INLSWSGSPEIKDPSVALNIFRILQESISNAVKYSDSKNIEINVSNKGIFSMEVKDDGRGFAMNGNINGFGIENMRKRAVSIDGKLHIKSDIGKGTQVLLEV
ncbi:MAG: histidine kinase, partial [Saprospiraceae bacterium]|nr:histidine kinase [Saprospiraceae bacterium]